MKEYIYIDENGQTHTIDVNIDLIKEFNTLFDKYKELSEVNKECI